MDLKKRVDNTSTGRYGQLPIGFSQSVAYGFDATTWKFPYGRIFDFTYDDQAKGSDHGVVTLRHGNADANYDVPDGSVVRLAIQADGTNATVFRGVRASDEKTFSLAVTTSLNVEGVSASTSTSIATDSKVDTDTTTSTAIVSLCKSIYFFAWATPGTLTSDFTGAVGKLPAAFDPGNTKLFFDFFNIWGSHYLSSGYFGGWFLMRTVLDETVTDKLDSTEIANSVSAGIKVGLDSASTKVDIKQTTVSKLNIDQKDATISFSENGGDSDQEATKFLDSVDLAPMLLYDISAISDNHYAPVFAPIYTLVADAARQAAMVAAWKAYLPPGAQGDATAFDRPIVETPASSATLPASRNGFALMCAAPGGDAVSDMSMILRPTQDANSPILSTVRNLVWRADEGDHWIQRASVILPVKAGSYYTKSLSAIPDGTTSGFVATALEFGDWSNFDPTAEVVAATDGFLTVEYSPPNNEAGVIMVEMDQIAALCAANNVPFDVGVLGLVFPDVAVSSLCVPVPKGTKITLSHHTDQGRVLAAPPGMTASWLPVIDRNWQFGAIKTLTLGDNVALQDGFAFGVLQTSGDGSRGYLEIRTLHAQRANDTLYSACAVHSYDKHGRHIPANTAMLPISAGKNWNATVTAYGNLDATIYWVPLDPVS